METIERIDSAPPSLSVSWSLFEDIILRHSVERPPFSIQVFTLQDLRLITDWAANQYHIAPLHFFVLTEIGCLIIIYLVSYFRHLRMYQLVFGGGKSLDLNVSHSTAQSVCPYALIIPILLRLIGCKFIQHHLYFNCQLHHIGIFSRPCSTCSSDSGIIHYFIKFYHNHHYHYFTIYYTNKLIDCTVLNFSLFRG